MSATQLLNSPAALAEKHSSARICHSANEPQVYTFAKLAKGGCCPLQFLLATGKAPGGEWVGLIQELLPKDSNGLPGCFLQGVCHMHPNTWPISQLCFVVSRFDRLQLQLHLKGTDVHVMTRKGPEPAQACHAPGRSGSGCRR